MYARVAVPCTGSMTTRAGIVEISLSQRVAILVDTFDRSNKSVPDLDGIRIASPLLV